MIKQAKPWLPRTKGGSNTSKRAGVSTAELKKQLSDWCSRLPEMPPDNPLLITISQPKVANTNKNKLMSSVSHIGLLSPKNLTPTRLGPFLTSRFRTLGPASPIVPKSKKTVQMTLHQKLTKQHKNYSDQQIKYHQKKHRRTSCVGSMQHAHASSNFSANAPLTDPRCLDKMSSTKGKTFGASSVSLTQAAATLRANIETEMQRYKGGSLKKLFDGYDANQSGVLNALEFESMVSHLVVYPVSLNNLRKLFKEIDEDQDGSIDFTEFESFIKRSVRDDRKNQKGAEYQDRKWKNGVGRHRKSIVSDRDEGRDEGGDTVSDLKTTSTLFSPTRSRQIYFTKTKQHHTTKHRKASSLGGFMAKGQGHDTGQDRLISPSALDAATALKPIGPAADQSLGNRREIAITKLSLALRTRNEELQTVFDKADHNHDGELQPEEFTEMVERFLPGEISRTEIFEVMKIMDLDGNGAVSFSEFRDGIFRNPVKFRSPHRARTKVDPVRKERKSIQSTEDGVGTSKKALTGLTVPTLDNQRGCPFVGAKKGKNNQNKKSKKESN